MNRKQCTLVLGLGAIAFVALGPVGCGTTGSTGGDAGIGALGGAALGGLIGYAAGGSKGAVIGAIAGGTAGAIAGAINADQFKKREARAEEQRIAQQNRDRALAQAKQLAGEEFDQINTVLTPVSRTNESTTYNPIDRRTGEIRGEVLELPNTEVEKITKQGGIVDASERSDIPVIGGEKVVFTS